MDRTKEGACLDRLVGIVKPILLKAEQGCQRTGPGRKPEIPDWVLGLLVVLATLKKKKSKSSQFRWLSSNHGLLRDYLDGHRLPCRSTYFSRFKRLESIVNQAIILLGKKAIRAGWADASVVAVDKSLMSAKGPKWWNSDRKKRRIPRGLSGVDRDSQWGYSSHHGWIQGYSFEVVVSCGKKGVIWPLIASVGTANLSEHRSFGDKIAGIPKESRFILADGGYDNGEFAARIEFDGNRRSGRRFLCPQNRRGTKGDKTNPKYRNESRKKYAARLIRASRRKYFAGKTATNVFKLRSQSVEPFNEWFKSTFEFAETVWHRGSANNRTQILAAFLGYQSLLTLNCKSKSPSGKIKAILDML